MATQAYCQRCESWSGSFLPALRLCRYCAMSMSRGELEWLAHECGVCPGCESCETDAEGRRPW